jgi:pyridoxamine 5'-phosphate oxidase
LPDFWGGFRVVPNSFEFWQGRPNRLHDRIYYQKENDQWGISRMSP